MSLGVSVRIVVDAIVAASERKDWDATQRLGERVRMAILDGVTDRNRSGLSEVASMLEIAEASLPESSGEAPLARVGWMLKMDATLAKLAARRIPAPDATVGSDDRSARDRILQALAFANDAPSVNSIAKASGLARETVSRLLPVMANQGLVKFKKVGRKTLSRITAQGRATVVERPVDAAMEIRNTHVPSIDFIMAAPPIAGIRAHVMVGAHAKRWDPIASADRNPAWFNAYADAHEGVISHADRPLPSLRGDTLRIISKDTNHFGRAQIVEISA